MRTIDRTWALVLAAGDGKRLSCLTTDRHGASTPKQFCSLAGGDSLLGLALQRAARVAAWERIATVVAEQHATWWLAELSRLIPWNIVVQPRNRGTAPGVLLPLLRILRRDAEATIIVLPSDHFFDDETVVERALGRALRNVEGEPDRLVLLGMVPDEMDAQFGWIVPAGDNSSDDASPVARFEEKPRADRAEALMQLGGLWNSFIFVVRGETLLALYERRLPGLVAAMQQALYEDARGGGPVGALSRFYDATANSDFCRDLLQGSEDCLRVLPVAPCGWSDLGTADRVARCVERLSPVRRPGIASGHARMQLVSQLRA